MREKSLRHASWLAFRAERIGPLYEGVPFLPFVLDERSPRRRQPAGHNRFPVFTIALRSNLMATAPNPPLSPMRIFETLRAYQQTAALRAAIELDIFTAIGEGATTAADIAAKRGASERGVRILCDTIVTDGLLAKDGGHYSCAPDAAVFLDRRSPACMASVSEFLCSPETLNGSLSLADCVRKGGTVQPGQGSVEPDNPFWVLFARAMAPMMALPAHMMADRLAGTGPVKVLDI